MAAVDQVSQDPSVQTASGTTGMEGTAPGPTGSIPSKLRSLDDLANSPEGKELRDKMLLSIATKIVNEIKDHQERLKKLWREMSEKR
ncbi:MAG: hypothetical protein H0V82_04820 [Candidatus Protochlamydia sp.]|nr:hypothetical protein [Candidatus Protochlamydia sp.]